MEVMGYCAYGIEDGFYKYFADQDKEKIKQLSPKARSLAVWADAKFITADIKKQLSSCTHKASPSQLCVQVALWPQVALHEYTDNL